MKTITYLILAFAMPLIATAQLQNIDFEDWINPVTEDMFGNRPVGWEISNGRAFMEGTNTYFPPATDRHNGNYALKLSIWYNYTKDMAEQTAPIASRPAVLTGYYKYNGNRVYSGMGEIDDKASATVYLTKWNEALSRHDTIGRGEVLLDAAEAYTRFVCPISYTNEEIPDSVKVILDCSLMNRPGYESILAPDGTGSFFTVDNIELTDDVLGNPLLQKDIAVYPNPVSDILNIPNFKGSVKVYDTTGKLVLSQAEHQQSISVAVLQSGIYHLQLNDDTGIYNAKFIKR